MISIVIPIYNEENILSKNSVHFRNLAHQAELIFVDGESTDKSVKIASNYGNVLHDKKGRATQMNSAAKSAKGDILFFLHADAHIHVKTVKNIEDTLRSADFIAGCLTQRIDKPDFIFRFIEGEGNIRARITKIFYGDQGIFVKKDVFLKMGGFPKIPIMEDIVFSKKLKALGKTVVLKDKIFVSARRWEKRGIIKTTLMYTWINIMFRIGFSLDRIKQLYEDLR